MLRKLLAISLLFICYSCFGKEEIILPFKIIEERIIINLNTQNSSLNLIFDTGSNISLLDSTLAERLGLNFGAKTYIMSRISPIPCYNTNFKINDAFSMLDWKITNLKNDTAQIDGLFGAYNLIKSNCTEIDFKNQVIKINVINDKKINSGVSFDLIDINKSVEGLGKYFPKLPAIQDTVRFATNSCRLVDLIIDTGSKFGVAFITGDTVNIKNIISFEENYQFLDYNKMIEFSKASWPSSDSIFYDAPMFYIPEETRIMNNDFYGFLGIPVLKKFDSIIIDYDNNRILFNPYY